MKRKNPHNKFWTDKRVDTLQALIAKGKSTKELVEYFNKTESAIRSAIYKYCDSGMMLQRYAAGLPLTSERK